MLNSKVQWVEENIEGGGLEERALPTLLLFIFGLWQLNCCWNDVPLLPPTIISAIGMMLPFLKGWHFWWSVGVGNCTVLQLEDCNGLFFLNVRQTPSSSPLFFFRIGMKTQEQEGHPFEKLRVDSPLFYRVAIRSLSYKFRGPLTCTHFSATPFSCDWRQ